MSEQDNSEFFDPVDEINKILSDERPSLPSIYEKVEKLDVVGEGKALVASANAKALPTRRVGRFEMLEVLERSLNRTVLNLTNPGERVFTALRELSDFLNMATTGAQPKVSNIHRDLLPVGHPLSTREHNFSTEELAQFHAEWMSADPRIAEEFRPLVASAFIAPASSLEREYVLAKLEATPATEVPRDVILSLTAGVDPYGGGNSFLARSARARAQRRDRRGRFAWMGGGARVWLGKALKGISTLFRFAGYDSKTDSFDLEIFNHPTLGSGIYSIPADQVEAIKAILPDSVDLGAPKPTLVDRKLLVDPATLVKKDAPTGWTKISSENGVDTFRSADGWIATRYPNLASAPNEPSITRVRGANDDKSINPDLPVYHIAKGSNDGLVVDKPFAVTQSWGDAQALISRYDKKMAPKEEKAKATLEEQPKEFIDGWTKGEGGYIPGKWNVYTEVSDRAGGKDFYTDPSGRYVAVKLATPPATWQIGAEQYKQTEDERTRRQVLESGLPIHTFDGAKDWDGNVDNLYRLERIKSDGKRELLGFYQDLEDIEKDTEIPPTEDKPQEFYESVIADTLQNGGNTIDFVDGNWPEDGYIVAHEADILQQDGTLGKREEIYTPEEFADPIEGPKILRAFVLKNQDKLSQQGFYLGTWLDTVKVTDEKGNVVDEREMVYLDVSEYEADFDKAFDMAEARKEIAIYGVATYDKDGNKGTSLYVADEKRRREIVRKTPVFDEKEAKRVMDEADKIMKEEDKWFSDNRLEVQKTGRTFWVGSGDDAIPNPELQKDYPEIYRRLKRRFDAEKSRRSVFQNYIRSIFDMSDGMDPGGRNDGLSGESLRTRDNYVGRDSETLKMNKALRDGGEVTSKVQKMDTLVKKSKVKDDTQFFRGAWLDPELVKDMGVGDMFFDRAFQSMGLNESTASSYLDFREKDFPNKSRVIFRLLLPKGMNAIHVGDDEVIARRNTKMRIIRKSELDGTTYFDVDVEPQTKEEIDARIQGRVPRPEQSEDGTSSSELPGNDGGGADGLGDGGPLPINYGPKPTGEEQAPRVTDPNLAIWAALPFDLGQSQNEIIDRAEKMGVPPERILDFYAQILKDGVANSVLKKLQDIDDKEFIKLANDLGKFTKLSEEVDWSKPKKLEKINLYTMGKKGDVHQDAKEFTDIFRWARTNPEFDKKHRKLTDKINSTGEINLEEAKLILDAYNSRNKIGSLVLWTPPMLPDTNDRKFLDAIRYTIVSSMVGQWASTSNGSDIMSLSIQEVAKREFGIKGSADWSRGIGMELAVEDVAKNNRNLIGRFLRAQYDLTQEYFKKKGISKITLFRGVKDFVSHDVTKSTFPSEQGYTVSIRLRPMSSWSTAEGVAIRFARGNGGKIFRKEYDVKDIIAFPGTGVGCYDEKEMVVLGGVVDSVDVGDYSPLNIDDVIKLPSPAPSAITYKEDQPQIQVNNAPINEAPKKMSNTERKRLEKEQRKAEEAAAPSPEQVKEQMQQARQGVAEVAQVLPETLDTFFDPNNPLNILNARNITNDITGTNINRDNLSRDDLLQQRLLFMEPTKEWYDLLDKIEQSGTPFAKEIISRIKKKHAKLIERIQRKALDERQAQIEHDKVANDILNVVNTLVNNALTRPNDVPGLNSATPILMAELDEYFNGNPNNKALADSNTIAMLGLINLYMTNNPAIATSNPQYNPNDVRKVMTDLISRFGTAYARYGTSSATPDRNALTKEIQKIYIENFFGGVNPTDTKNTLRVMSKLSQDRSLASILPSDIVNILSDKSKEYSKKRKTLADKKVEVTYERQELATKLSQTTKEVLSENGIEFDHGVKVSSQDVNWSGVHDFEFVMNANNEIEFRPTQMPDYLKANLAPELKNVNGALSVLNEALQSYPKPVALALRQFLIDNKSSFSFFSTSRGVTAILNPKELDKVHDIGDISGAIKHLGISGSTKEGAVETSVHELLHLIVNGIFRNQMNSIAWAKQSKETNNVAPDGKIFHNFVDGNYGNVAYPPTGNYSDPDDIMRMIQANELGAASPNFATPYIGKYGVAAGAQAAVGQNPFAHGELLSTLIESLLGGGLTGMFNTAANPKKVLSGVNPDGTPKYTTMDDSVFSESMLPFGVSMIVLLNELAKLKLGIA